jgi:hypothetical protein
MKLLIPRPRGGSVWACTGSFWRRPSWPAMKLVLTCVWAPTRAAFWHPGLHQNLPQSPFRPCGHHLRAELATTVRCWCSHPIPSNPSPVRAMRSGRSSICNPAPAWFCLTGLVPAAPRAGNAGLSPGCKAATRFSCPERMLLDSLLLDQAHGPLDGAHRHGPLQLPGAARHGWADWWPKPPPRMLAEVETLPVPPGANSSSAPAPFGKARAAHCGRTVARKSAAKSVAAWHFVAEFALGDDPWARKW